MLTKQEIKVALKQANLSEMYKEFRRYGRITADSEFTLDSVAHRLITIEHYNMSYIYHLVGGEVTTMRNLENDS